MRFVAFLASASLLLASAPVRAQQDPRPHEEEQPPGPQYPPAQPYPPQPPVAQPPVVAPQVAPEGTVPLVVRNDAPGMTNKVSTADGIALGSCVGSCTLFVRPNQQVVFEAESTEDLRGGRKVFFVSGPTSVEVSPGSKSGRTTGLIMGIVGPVAIVVGLFGLMFTAVANSRNDCSRYSSSFSTRDCNENDASYTPWVVSLVGGIGLTVGGWVMFGASGTKIKQASTFASLKPRFAAVPTRDGMSMGLTFAF